MGGGGNDVSADCVAAGAVAAAGARVEVLVPPAAGERSSMAIEPPVEVVTRGGEPV